MIRDPSELIRPDLERVPAALQEIPHWVMWKLVKKKGDAKLQKVPFHPDGYKFDPHKPENWLSFEEVCRIYEKSNVKFSGVGFVPAGCGIVGIDFDDCVNGDGQPTPERQKDIQALGSYAELSPSGQGIRVFAFGKLPANGKKDDAIGVEIYQDKRFLTVTGHPLPEMPSDVEDRSEAVSAFYNRNFGAKSGESERKRGENERKDPVFDLIRSEKSHDGLVRYAKYLIDKGLDRETAIETGRAVIRQDVTHKPEKRLEEWPGMVDWAIRNNPEAADDNPDRYEGIKDAILTADAFEALNEAPRQCLLWPWLQEQSITLISGWRGVGKSWFTLGILDAVTGNTALGPWECKKSMACLYIDGEMVISDGQERLKGLNLHHDRVSPFYLYSDAYANRQGLPRANLADPRWRDAVGDYALKMGIGLIGIDNIASLTPGMDEKLKEEWDPINQWMLTLRYSGVSTILDHHLGKGGDQRGASAREDNIDTSIKLIKPQDYQEEDGARFVVQFTKKRLKHSRLPSVMDIEFSLRPGKRRNYEWLHIPVKEQVRFKVLAALGNGTTQKKIADEFGITQPRTSQMKRGFICDGFLTTDGNLTTTGEGVLSQREGI